MTKKKNSGYSGYSGSDYGSYGDSYGGGSDYSYDPSGNYSDNDYPGYSYSPNDSDGPSDTSNGGQNGNGGFDYVSLIISLIGGVVCFIIGNIIYTNLMFSGLWRPLVVGIFFLIVATVLFLVAKLCALIGGYSRASGKDNLKALIMAVAIFAAGTLFELIYEQELTISRTEQATPGNFSSYVFLMDTTASMGWNDPGSESKRAIAEVMKNEEGTKYCVYTFEEDAHLYHGMMDASQAADQVYSFTYGGGTDIIKSLNTVFDDIAKGTIAAGNRPLIILATDGEDNGDMNRVLSKADNVNATICVIGFGDADESFVRSLADGSGGAFKMINDASQLTGSLQGVVDDAKKEIVATTAGFQRDLLNTRIRAGLDWVLAIERLLFLILLGLMFLLLKSFQIRSGGTSSKTLIPNVVVIAIGALGIELGMNMLGLPAFFMRMLLCMCFTMIITCKGIPQSYPVLTNTDAEFQVDEYSPKY